VAVLGGILGAIVGFAIGVTLTEVVFPNGKSWPDVVAFGFAVAGIGIGSALGRRLRRRTA